MTQRKRKATLKRPKRKAVEEITVGSPPVPQIVPPKPKPSLWQRINRVFGWD